ncbi:unnamed protein product [Urochloa decumbens]|uniref:F-box domain-containing protein n=1 Tax=Urochloa decumbens TaxID=240449 RepID=A0ABC9FPM6_9POAL
MAPALAPAPALSSRSRLDIGSAAVLPLPLDVSYKILLCLPAKDLCHLRTVSWAWRFLLSDPQFIAAHGAGAGPGGIHGDDVRFNIMDLSGRILKRLHVAGDGTDNATDDLIISSQAGLVCILGAMGKRCRLLDPATGAVTSLPDGLAEEHAANQPHMGQYSAAVMCGKVASTGEHKVLRVLDIRLLSISGYNLEPLCEALTLDGSGNARWRGKEASPDPVSVCDVTSRQFSGTGPPISKGPISSSLELGTGPGFCRLGPAGNARWRGKKASPNPISMHDVTSRAVVDDCVYFFLKELAPLHIVGPKRIASFDLGIEEDWRRTLEGPQIVRFVGNNDRRRHSRDDVDYNHFSLAALNGCLAVVHCVRSSFMDLWFLMDFDEGLWVKQHSIHMKSVG